MKLPEGHYPLGRFSFVISLLFALRLGLLQLQQKNTSESKTAYVTDKQLVICTPDVQPSAIKRRAFLLIIKCL